MIAKIKKIKKRKESKSLFFIVSLGFLVVFLIFAFVVSNWKIQKKRSELKAQIEQIEKEIERVEKRNQELRAGISQGLTEISLEREAREKFNLKKPEEKVVTVLLPEEEEKETSEKKSFWKKIWEKIKLW